MKHSLLLSKILRSKWFLEPSSALAYQSLFSNLITGSNFNEDDFEKKLSILLINPSGNHLTINASSYLSGEEKIDTIFDEVPEGSIAFIPLKGTLLKEDTLCSYGTETLSSLLKLSADHKNIKAAIIHTHSGGGCVDAVPPMIDSILYAKEKMPVIGLADMAASAAYYSLAPCSTIIAENDISSEFGSIGVMISFMDVQPMWEREGVKFHTIYAPESTHKNLDFENALKGDYDLIKTEMLSPLAKKFQEDVRNYRKGKINLTVPGILNGKMFYAKQAVEYGLADEIGNMAVTIEKALELSKSYK